MLVTEIMKYSTDEITKAIAAKVSNNTNGVFIDNDFIGVSTDSRSVKSGDLFFALKGESFDGHRFVEQAIAKGAAGVVVSEDIESDKTIVFKVDDTLKALGDLASFVRSQYNIKCIAITGSNGKTTTKEILAACLRLKYNTLKSEGNFNNLIGVPLSIFQLNETHEAAVFELGMSYPGEISRLAQISHPQVGIFTNIAPAHLESMGSIEAIAKAKRELIDGLPSDGTAVINVDNQILASWIKDIKQNVITYGINDDADYRAENIEITADGSSKFNIKEIQYHLSFPGRHNIYNAVAAIAGASTLGIGYKELSDTIDNIKPYKQRSEIFTVGGITIINDCYNANPESMKAAIDLLAGYPSAGRRIAVLGDMLELGTNEIDFHKQIGSHLKIKNIDALFAIGKLAEFYLNNYSNGFKALYKDKTEMAEALKRFLHSGDVVLIKGSRGAVLEKVTEKLMELK